MSSDDQVFNAWSLGDLLGCPVIYGGRGNSKPFKVQFPATRDEQIEAATWDEAVRKANAGDVWMVCNGGDNAWFPASAVAAVEGRRWSSRGKGDKPGPKITFTPGRPCEVTCSRDEGRWTSFWTCCRLAVTCGRDPGIGRQEVIPLCSFHVKVNERREAKNQEFHARLAEASVENSRRKQTKAVCEETLDRVRPLLAELGVHPKTVVVGSAEHGERIGILLPAEAVELLVGKAIELEAIEHG